MRLVLPSTLALLLLSLTAACGETPKNTNVPPPPAKLAPPPSPLWENLAAALGIGINQEATEAALRAQLATPSSYLASARAADYAKLVGTVAQTYGAAAYATRCAEIVAVQKLAPAKLVDPLTGKAEDFAGATLHLMSYKLQADGSGKAETNPRSGLIVIPTTGSANSVIAAYAHGGDFGLGYAEVAAAFGELQGNHVVVAPTYPGEPLCKQAADAATRACDAAGVIVPAGTRGAAYDADADELLGMYDCVMRAGIGKADAKMLDETGKDTGVTLAAALNPLLKRHGAGTAAQVPQGIVFGTSRGGLVAQIALAKTGAALSALSAASAANPAPLGPAYLSPAYFSCAAVVSGPASFAFAEFRLMLEQWVKGRLASTSFAAFPGMASLSGLFDAYRDGTVAADAAALAVVRRDAPLTAPLQLAALRNWAKFTQGTANGGPGAMLVLHGLYDKVVPISQAQLNFNVMLQASTSPTLVSATDPAKSPGLALFGRGFTPKADLLEGGKLKAGHFQHGDAAFFGSTAIIPGDFISATVTGQALPSEAGEAAANGLAQKIFSVPTPSAAQLKAARGYILAGILAADAVPKPVAAADAAGGETIHLVEEALTPAAAFGAWRLGACAAALTN